MWERQLLPLHGTWGGRAGWGSMMGSLCLAGLPLGHLPGHVIPRERVESSPARSAELRPPGPVTPEITDHGGPQTAISYPMWQDGAGSLGRTCPRNPDVGLMWQPSEVIILEFQGGVVGARRSLVSASFRASWNSVALDRFFLLEEGLEASISNVSLVSGLGLGNSTGINPSSLPQ